MKCLIYLKTEYKENPANAFKQFKQDIKQWSYIKIVKELPPHPQVIIEFPDDKSQEVYENFLNVDIVSVFDTVLPKGE